MILRVYAMYSRSRIVLHVLLVIYITGIVLVTATCSIYSNPDDGTGTYRTNSTDPCRASCNSAPSVHLSTSRHHGLQRRVRCTRVELRVHDQPVHSRYGHVHPGDRQVREGLAPDVSGDAEMAVEQIHESPRQRRSFIFPCVRSPVWFPLLPA